MIQPGARDLSAAGPWVGRATLVVAAILAGAVGHLILAPGAGARVPVAPSGPSTAVFEALTLPVPGDGAADGPRDEQGQAPGVGSVDDWGLTLSTAAGSLAVATPEPEPPAVVRFRPRDGWTNVDRHARLSVRFTTAMDRATAEAAFHASIDGSEIEGTVRWAEGDTVLVLDPAVPLPYSVHVELRVEAGALSADGLALVTPAAISFTVEAKPVAPVAAGSSSGDGWQWPLIGPITQRFGETLTAYGFHQGIDIDGDTGDPVRAARSGVVVIAGHADECGGLQVRIDHDGGLLTWYRHLSAIGTTVGARVEAGTVIGRVGATGCALGSHLHFGISLDGDFIDPLRYLPRR